MMCPLLFPYSNTMITRAIHFPSAIMTNNKKASTYDWILPKYSKYKKLINKKKINKKKIN